MGEPESKGSANLRSVLLAELSTAQPPRSPLPLPVNSTAEQTAPGYLHHPTLPPPPSSACIAIPFYNHHPPRPVKTSTSLYVNLLDLQP